MRAGALALRLSLIVLPEQLIQCFAQYPADLPAQVDGGVVIPFFDGHDGLP